MRNNMNEHRARAEALFRSPAAASVSSSTRLSSEQDAMREKTERLRAMRLQREEAERAQSALSPSLGMSF